MDRAAKTGLQRASHTLQQEWQRHGWRVSADLLSVGLPELLATQGLPELGGEGKCPCMLARQQAEGRKCPL